jgi:hypothetical protein
LTIVTSGLSQERCLLGPFDPFGHGVEAEPASKPNDGMYDLQAAGLGQHFSDERAIDLKFVNVELVQITQARISGAEIIDGNLDPRCFNSDIQPRVRA